MKQTERWKLNLPDYTDKVDIEKINENFKIIEQKVAEEIDALARSIMLGGEVESALATNEGDEITTDNGDGIMAVREF